MANFCTQCGKPVAPNANFCMSCGAPVAIHHNVTADVQKKRQKVVGKREQSGARALKILTIVGFAAFVIVMVYNSLPKKTNPVIEAQPIIAKKIEYPDFGQQMFDIPSKVQNGKIIISLDDVKQRQFVAFNYVNGAKIVPLLAYISPEGKLVTAVSMCEPCNSRRFHIQGDEIICNSCGTTWKLDNLDAISGACGNYPPDPIPSTVVGNTIQIDEAVVANWRSRI
ncbi:MAG: Fe-S-containing protein [Bacteroidota bacterium]